MDLQVLKSKISSENVFDLLQEFDAEPFERGDHFEILTVCHGGDSHKLFYYKETFKFMCFTHCGSFDIIEFVEKVKNISTAESIEFLKKRFNIHDNGEKYVAIEKAYNPCNAIKKRKDVDYSLKIYDDKVLQSFYSIAHKSWVDEDIKISSIAKYNIKYDLGANRIIIPVYDINDNLVGIRGRNLDEHIVEKYGKYTPIVHKKQEYKFQTGHNLYGINVNKDTINASKRVILFESEKSVIKMDSMYGKSNGLALTGSMFTDAQMKLLGKLDVSEVVIALDKEYEDIDTRKSFNYARKIYSMFSKLKNRYVVSVLWDKENLLEEKMSPVDKDKKTFETLMRQRIVI